MKVHHLCTMLALLAFFVACGQASTAPSATPSAPTPPRDTLIGTWRATVTKADLLRVMPDFKQEFLCDNSGTFTWQFKADGSFIIDQTALEGCPTPAPSHIESTWDDAGKVVTFAKGTPDQEEYAWAIDGDLLTFTYQSGNCIPCKATNTANPWKRVA